MPERQRLTISKSFTYQGAGREWSNTHPFHESAPSVYGDWEDFADAVVALERTILQNDVTITTVKGYDGASDHPVFTKTYGVVGTLSVSGASNAPRDCAGIIRWSTADRDSRNHPIYGYAYVHGVADYDSGSGHPAGWMYEPQTTALETYANDWVVGINGFHRTTLGGSICIDSYVDPWIRHRDFRL
jgi:hypothetical protein